MLPYNAGLLLGLLIGAGSVFIAIFVLFFLEYLVRHINAGLDGKIQIKRKKNCRKPIWNSEDIDKYI